MTRARAVAADTTAAWQPLLEALPHPAWVVELARRRVVAVNEAAVAFLARPREELVGEPAEELARSPEDLSFWAAVAQGEPPNLNTETLIAAPDGRAVPVSRSVKPISVGAAAASHALVVVADRSAEYESAREREMLMAEQQATLECTDDGILVTDLAGHVRGFNRRFAELWTMPLALLQQREAAVMSWMARSVADPEAYDARVQALSQASLIVATDRLELHSGQVFERVTRPLLVGGRLQGRVWCFRDLTERLAAQSHIESMSSHDTLTGLANRRLLAERVTEASAAARDDGVGFALLLIDVDRFRRVNDSLGNEIGDRVLLEVAQRLQGTVRQNDVLARLGGDQFALLLRPCDAEAAEAAARRVLNVVAQPCIVDGAQLSLTCSAGVVMAPARGADLDELLRMSEMALRAAKSGGRAAWRMHESRAEVDRQSRIKLDHAMRRALVSGRFRLHYQPQISLVDGSIVAAEALLRWRDPALGELPPGRFLPIAEDTGFILAIGDWVLAQALKQATQWQQRGHTLPVAVNISPLQFQQAGFVEGVATALSTAGVAGSLLELEITEAILAQDPEAALQRLDALSRLGVRLVIDDFGTGFSSVAHLGRVAVSKIKLDRSFVSGLPDDEDDAVVTQAVLQMARALGVQAVAEGVETEAQRQFLLDAGCDAYQGHLFAPALDALTFQHRLPPGGGAPPAPRRAAPRIRLVRG